MRVVQIIPTLVRGGAEKQMTMLAKGLHQAGIDTHVLVLTHTGPLEEDLRAAGVPVTLIGKRWKFDPSCYFRLKAELKRLAPDLVHTWLFAANAYGRQAAKSVGVKHILAGERCVDPWKGWWQLAVDRYLAPSTERIVTNSSGVKDFYVSKGLPADKFTIIPNGISDSSVPASAQTKEEFLKSLGLPSDSKLIATVGRLWPQKRIKDLIWAMDLLKCVRTDAHLLLIGDGPQRQALEAYQEKVEITDHVHFLGERKDVSQILPHLDCFWLASSYEGQSNAIMEAMLAGIPVVASDIPGNRDLVVPDKTGYLFPIGERGEIAKITQALLDDLPLAKKLGAGGRERMQSEFTVEKMVSRHIDLYRSLYSA